MGFRVCTLVMGTVQDVEWGQGPEGEHGGQETPPPQAEGGKPAHFPFLSLGTQGQEWKVGSLPTFHSCPWVPRSTLRPECMGLSGLTRGPGHIQWQKSSTLDLSSEHNQV